jgi:RNA polymerase sigma-70 factor (ECF subfamily)
MTQLAVNASTPSVTGGQRPPWRALRQAPLGAAAAAQTAPVDDEDGNSRLVSQAVRRAQVGDREALGFLYARFADNVYGYVRSIVRDHHEAEDVTQHVFAKMMRVIDKYEERDVPFFAWLLRVARNVAVDYIRSERLVPVEEVRPEGGARAATVDPTASNWSEELREALDTLPPAQRQVLLMRHVAGLSPAEIADLTGKSEGSIHGLHHRGRRAMTAELASRGMAPATRAGRTAA